MKHLPMPQVDDDAKLDEVAAHRSLARTRHLNLTVIAIKRRYADYIAARGNPHHPQAPQPTKLAGRLQEALNSRYESAADTRVFISHLRESNRLNCCPMCGGAFPQTVDHVFPRNPGSPPGTSFKDLSLFSRNLVPACGACNLGRKNNYKGSMPGARVLHPYFDAEMDRRLLVATIAPVHGQYVSPTIGIWIVADPKEPIYAAITYHIEVVLTPVRMLYQFDVWWSDYQRADNGVIDVVGSAFTDEEFNAAISKALRNADKEFKSYNNWKSILLAGIERNDPAKRALAEIIRRNRLSATSSV